MLGIKTIMHPTDFSKSSEYAFGVACALARDYGADLLLVHVKPLPTVVFGEFGVLPPEPPELPEALEKKLHEMLPADANIPVEYHLLEGEPAQEIVRLAKENEVDVIVMGSHGRTGFGRLVMGSVAEQVVRHATCAVLTVKQPLAEREALKVAEVQPAIV